MVSLGALVSLLTWVICSADLSVSLSFSKLSTEVLTNTVPQKVLCRPLETAQRHPKETTEAAMMMAGCSLRCETS